ncbi:hypothetical protein [Cognatishimia sp. MH4019]|uniref:hypothetical protein n=1 Tax=Cognatishimia sp. MH4019 TaxID=2854030 RepID=UPI001CD41A89|nr:hypothetical protein [Cognatishimia sp. MH4019]
MLAAFSLFCAMAMPAAASGTLYLNMTDGSQIALEPMADGTGSAGLVIAPDGLGCPMIHDGEAIESVSVEKPNRLNAVHPLVRREDLVRISPEGLGVINCVRCATSDPDQQLVGNRVAFSGENIRATEGEGMTRYQIHPVAFTLRVRWQQGDRSNRAPILGFVLRTERWLFPLMTMRTAAQLGQLSDADPAFAKATNGLYASDGACLSPLFAELADRAREVPQPMEQQTRTRWRPLLCYDPDRDLTFLHMPGGMSRCGGDSYRISEMDYLAREIADGR